MTVAPGLLRLSRGARNHRILKIDLLRRSRGTDADKYIIGG
jgi:hypothetical protein